MINSIFDRQQADCRQYDLMDAIRAEMRNNSLEVQIRELQAQNKKMLDVIDRQTATILKLSERIEAQALEAAQKQKQLYEEDNK